MDIAAVWGACRGTMSTSAIDRIIEAYRSEPGGLLPALHAVQEALGHLPSDALVRLAQAFKLSRAEVHGVVSFYRHLHRELPGQHIVELCRAEACQARGARELARHAQAKLGVGFGETTGDGRISLRPVYCLGNCACTPSIAVDGRVYARVTPERFDALIDAIPDHATREQ